MINQRQLIADVHLRDMKIRRLVEVYTKDRETGGFAMELAQKVIAKGEEEGPRGLVYHVAKKMYMRYWKN